MGRDKVVQSSAVAKGISVDRVASCQERSRDHNRELRVSVGGENQPGTQLHLIIT